MHGLVHLWQSATEKGADSYECVIEGLKISQLTNLKHVLETWRLMWGPIAQAHCCYVEAESWATECKAKID